MKVDGIEIDSGGLKQTVASEVGGLEEVVVEKKMGGSHVKWVVGSKMAVGIDGSGGIEMESGGLQGAVVS